MSDLHPILQKLRQIQTSERRWLFVFAISLFFALSILAVILVGLIDFYWRSNLWVSRAFLTACLLVIVGYVCLKILTPAIFFRRGIVDVAKALEKQNPQLRAHLSLAADFLSTQNLNGSSQLRDELVDHAERDLDQISGQAQIKTKAPIRALSFFAIAAFVGVSLIAISPRDSLFAVKRTVAPFSSMPWPSYNQLEFSDLPEKIAAGDSFLCIVHDKNQRLPKQVALEIDDGSGGLRRPMMIESDRATFRVSNVTQSIRIRAIGGDSDTGWKSIEVMNAPKVSELKVDVTPPAYSNLPPYSCSPFQKIWADSTIRIRGKTDLNFEKAEFIFLSGENGQPAMKISPREFAFPASQPMIFSQSFQFRVELTDNQKLVGGKKRDFHLPVRTDEPPFAELTILNRRSLYSPEDSVELELVASDDMQIKRLSLEMVGHSTVNFSSRSKSAKLATDNERDEIRESITINLSDFKLQPEGDEIQLAATVIDAKGSASRSNQLSIRIGSEHDLETLDVQQRSKILERIAETLELQTAANNLNSLILESKTPSDPALLSNRLESISNQQRQVEEMLFGREGVIFFCDQYKKSGYANRDAQRVEEIENIREKILQTKRSVQAATNQAGEAVSFSQTRDVALTFANKTHLHQLVVLKVLKSLVGDIDVDTRLQSCLADLKNLLEIQQDILKESEQFETLTSVASQRILNSQSGVSNKLNELSWGLLNDSKKLGAVSLQSLGEKIKRIELDSKAAAQSISQSRFGLALEKMNRVVEGIQNILSRSQDLKNNLSPETKEKLDAAVNSFSPLMDQTEKLQGQLDKWSDLDSNAQQELTESLDLFRSQLQEFLNANQSMLSEAARTAIDDINRLMTEIAEDLKNGNVQDARNKFGQVQEKMKMIGAELDAKSSQVERMMRKERFKQLQVKFARWLDLETKVKVTIEDSQPENLSSILEELTEVQRKITSEIKECRESNIDLFALDLELEKLQSRSAALESQLADANQAKALVHLQEIISILDKLVNQNSTKENPQGKDQNADSKSGDSNSADDVKISEFEIQLIRLMQEEILAETKRIEKLRGESPTPQQRAALRQASLELADRQSELVATVSKYLTPSKKADTQTVPDIPEIETIPDIPDLPECGSESGPASDQENIQQDDDSSLQDKDEKKVEAFNPFEKQGEDIGEKSNSVRNRLQAIKSKMMSVQDLLIKQQLAEENQDIQTKIIDELKLFATDQQKKSNNKKQEKTKQKTSKKGDQSATSSETTQNADSDVKDDNSADNALIQKRIDDIWGHLPEQIRKTELNIRSDQFLPKYRELIKQYFKRLAKEPVNR